MTVRIYRSTDAGAPTRGALNGLPVNMLRQVFRACLIDGYGSKPAAGWSIVDEGSAGFSFTNANGSGIINLWMPVAAAWYYPIAIYLAESFTGSTNGKITGDNLRSGPWYSGSSVTQRHLIWPCYGVLASELAYSHWTMIADENTAIFIMNSRLESGTSRTSDLFLYMGEVDSSLPGPACFVVSGGSNSFTESDNINNFSTILFGAFGMGYTALRNMNTGVTPASAVMVFPNELVMAGNNNPPDMGVDCAYGDKLSFSRAKVFTGSSAGLGHAGFFKGVAVEPSLSVFGWKTAMSALGLARDDASVGMFVGPPGNSVAVFSGRSVNTFFATDNPDFW